MHFPLDHNGVLYLWTSPPVPPGSPKLLYLNRRGDGGKEEKTDGWEQEEEIWRHTKLHFQSLNVVRRRQRYNFQRRHRGHGHHTFQRTTYVPLTFTTWASFTDRRLSVHHSLPTRNDRGLKRQKLLTPKSKSASKQWPRDRRKRKCSSCLCSFLEMCIDQSWYLSKCKIFMFTFCEFKSQKKKQNKTKKIVKTPKRLQR